MWLVIHIVYFIFIEGVSCFIKDKKTHNITVSHNINNNSWIEMELGRISLKPHKTSYCFKTKPLSQKQSSFFSQLFPLSESCMHNEACSFVEILPWAPVSCKKELYTYKVHSLSLQQQALVWDVCGSVPWLSPVQQSPLQPQPRHTMPEWPYICENQNSRSHETFFLHLLKFDPTDPRA